MAPPDFHNVLFPLWTAVEHDEEGGFLSHTHRTYNRYVVRVQQTQDSYSRWDVRFNLNTRQKIAEAINFGIGRRGQGYSFRFLDPFDHMHDHRIVGGVVLQVEPTFYNVNGAAIFYTAAGGETSIQLKQPRGDVTNPYYKPITKPVDTAVFPDFEDFNGNTVAYPTLVLEKNAVPLVGGGVDYTLDFNTGLITGLSGVLAADEFAYSGAHHKHALMNISMGKLTSMASMLANENIDAHRIGTIPLIELPD